MNPLSRPNFCMGFIPSGQIYYSRHIHRVEFISTRVDSVAAQSGSAGAHSIVCLAIWRTSVVGFTETFSRGTSCKLPVEHHASLNSGPAHDYSAMQTISKKKAGFIGFLL